jgi:hypothetical protein
MILIGFTGPPGAGKDTAFKILESLLKEKFDIRRYSFADPIRDIAERMMSLPPGEHRFWDAELKDKVLEEFNFHSPREMLIDLGMMGRKYRPDIWLDLAVDKILDDKPDVAVITDVRFLNEARKVRSLNGELIDIARPGYSYDSGRQSESGEAAGLATRKVVNTTMGAFQHAVEDAWWRIVSDRGGVL